MKKPGLFNLNERGASSWDLVLKILSITLVSLFAFSSGVWFGKKLSDSDHQRLALEGEFDREVRKTASHDDAGDAGIDDRESLTDEEVAAAADKAMETYKGKAETADHVQAEKAVTEKAVAQKAMTVATQKEVAPISTARSVASTTGATTNPAATKHDGKHEEKHESKTATAVPAPANHAPKSAAVTSPAPQSKKPDLSAAHQAAVRVASNAAPVAVEAPPAESRVPSSLPKTVGATNDVEFTVQIASYPTAEAAKEHVESMVKKGFPAFPVEAKINGKTWYRVSVGSFKSFNDASKFRAQLLKQADLPSAIVQKVTR